MGQHRSYMGGHINGWSLLPVDQYGRTSTRPRRVDRRVWTSPTQAHEWSETGGPRVGQHEPRPRGHVNEWPACDLGEWTRQRARRKGTTESTTSGQTTVEDTFTHCGGGQCEWPARVLDEWTQRVYYEWTASSGLSHRPSRNYGMSLIRVRQEAKLSGQHVSETSGRDNAPKQGQTESTTSGQTTVEKASASGQHVS